MGAWEQTTQDHLVKQIKGNLRVENKEQQTGRVGKQGKRYDTLQRLT